ncbi:hypothetical protein BCR44DRAFT_1429748 [Catenaria anguillulae PL171]|uniref:Uncharacterized protein n=1 Tax=Catenaria anguillulae PL171 TaxID=765915 RepID=A0A1Y2HSW6_9FUNG|nr:hypothetical protein BCR44DRAFT_1429738 [Catenaria anguillulae PL171]ORZ37688.1 hypothetical protein BCR44DRAFT_1429748 [Catenaria anguillulae PL171]
MFHVRLWISPVYIISYAQSLPFSLGLCPTHGQMRERKSFLRLQGMHDEKEKLYSLGEGQTARGAQQPNPSVEGTQVNIRD